MKHLRLGIAITCLCTVLSGCTNADTTATAEEERAFRNPPKNPPPEAVEAMKRGMSQHGK